MGAVVMGREDLYYWGSCTGGELYCWAVLKGDVCTVGAVSVGCTGGHLYWRELYWGRGGAQP